MGFEKPIRMCNDAVIMNSYKHHNLLKTIGLALCLAITPVLCRPAMAISIKEEEKLAREFMKVMGQRYELVSDPAIVRYVNEIGKKILAVMPVQPFTYRFYVIKEDVYNAFAIPAGQIFIHSGLLAAMESEDELAGIIGHEIAHVVHRHISKRIERAKKNRSGLHGRNGGRYLPGCRQRRPERRPGHDHRIRRCGPNGLPGL
jgi:Zn-dependent protease with chaperone function